MHNSWPTGTKILQTKASVTWKTHLGGLEIISSSLLVGSGGWIKNCLKNRSIRMLLFLFKFYSVKYLRNFGLRNVTRSFHVPVLFHKNLKRLLQLNFCNKNFNLSKQSTWRRAAKMLPEVSKWITGTLSHALPVKWSIIQFIQNR